MSDIKLFNDNCMKILPTLPDGSITMTLTDIPYDEVNRKSGGLRNLDKSHADIITFPLDDFIDEVVRVTSGSIYIFCGSVQVSHIRDRLIEHNMSAVSYTHLTLPTIYSV